MKSKYFVIEELVPETLLALLHEDVLWRMFDPKLLASLDKLKEVFNEGSMSINTYKWSGDRTQSGIRTKDSTFYSETSQHSVGRAFDAVFSDYDETEVRRYVIEHLEEFPYVRGIEDFEGMGWVHIDVRNTEHAKVFGKA